MVNVDRLEQLLAEYPDSQTKEYLLSGLKQGFHTGLAYIPSDSMICKNNLSCQKNIQVASELLEYEVAQGYVVGPFSKSPFPSCRVNPISIAHGKYSNKPRLVVDLSAPH
jgi:hypothetical protein